VLVFISGAVRSGKSTLGEELAVCLAGGKRKIYLATSRHYDQEMTKRIELHQQKRAGRGFLTIEKSSDLGDVVSTLRKSDTVLLDCLGTLLANEMFDRKEMPASKFIQEKLWADLLKLYESVENLIVISNEVFGDGIVYDGLTESYIRTLGKLHCKLAKASDVALECIYAGYLCYKGNIPGCNLAKRVGEL